MIRLLFLSLTIVLFLVAYRFNIVEKKLKQNFNAKIERLELIVQKNKINIKNLTKRINELDKVTVKATSYTNAKDETNEDNENTACMDYPSIGSIAVSQDLFWKGWTCGKRVFIKGIGIVVIKDVMHERKTKQIDIVKETKEQANQFGVKHNLKAVLLSNYENM